MAQEIVDHRYDVVVVGAGGAGLRTALGTAGAGLATACVSKLHPLHSPTGQAQGGIAAPLGNLGADDWRFFAFDTVKGSDWLGDQDAIEYLCRDAARAVLELEHYGMPFTRTEDGRIYQRSYGGHTVDYGDAPARRACAAADRVGLAMLHTLYQQALKRRVALFPEFVALDLLMTAERACAGVLAWSLAEGRLHRFRARATVLATGGFARIYRSTTTADAATGDGNAMALRAGLALQDMEFVQFHPTGLHDAGCLISEAARGEGGHLVNALGERFMDRYAPESREIASRDVVSRAMGNEIHAGRGCGRRGDHLLLRLDHLDADLLRRRLPRILESARAFAGVDATREPIPVVPTAHFTMGGIPTNHRTEVLRGPGRDLAVCPGLFALGETACVSVHGANRLGCNSLLELLVFARAAAQRIAELTPPGRAPPAPAAESEEAALARFERTRHASGAIPASRLRERLQDIMQVHCGVFRDGPGLRAGLERLAALDDDARDLRLEDRSLCFNTELLEALEFDGLRAQAAITLHAALARQESRGAHARDDYPLRNDKDWLRHSLARRETGGAIALDFRPVQLAPLSSDLPSFPPQARSY